MDSNSKLAARLNQFKQWISDLSKVDKVFLVALAVRLLYPLVLATSGVRLPGYGLIRGVFILITIVFLIFSFPKLMRSLLWRVRHRLVVTWILVGVVPIILICSLMGQGLYILMGQVLSYMTSNELARHNLVIQGTAHELAWSMAHRGPAVTMSALTETFVKETGAARKTEIGAVVHDSGGSAVVPADGAIREIPAWSKSDFVGLLNANGRYYFAAHVVLGDSAKTEVFLYEYAPVEFFKGLLPGVATVSPGEGTVTGAGGMKVGTTNKKQSGFSINLGDQNGGDPDFKGAAPPPGRGRWDVAVGWLVYMPTLDVKTGESEEEPNVAIVTSRPSLILGKLFSNFSNLGFVAFFIMLFIGIVLLIVEIVAALFGAKLTRSITRSVADLYEGTRKVQAGDFSHRIPMRKTKDQLAELAGSFNNMTERIEHLIVEVKEKEKLENELQIARDVQSQLLPKEFPHLKTLELWGGCQPARTVSGDYYDFVSLGANRAALAIGDISGKGISAALLMAHIQSALRSQLLRGTATSSASVLSIVNDHLYANSPPEKYATFFLGLYTDESGQLIYTNAGHLAPMILRRGQVLRLPGEGFPVGMFPGAPFEQLTFTLEPGDLLVGFTDGVTETPNRDGEEFGDQRVTELLQRHSGKPLDRIAAEITTSVSEWAGDVERHDDTTIVLARHV